jgi:hypothetical protein
MFPADFAGCFSCFGLTEQVEAVMARNAGRR